MIKTIKRLFITEGEGAFIEVQTCDDNNDYLFFNTPEVKENDDWFYSLFSFNLNKKDAKLLGQLLIEMSDDKN